MQKSSTWKAAREKVNNSPRSVMLQSEEASDGFFLVLVNHPYLRLSEHQGSKSRQKDRNGIKLVYVKTACRVSSMPS